MSRWVLLVALGCATISWTASAAGSRPSAAIQKRLRSVEDALKGKDWQGALEGAGGLLASMALGDFRGPGSRPVYGLAFAFRALAAEELGRHVEADWDWSCARALDETVVGVDFSPLGDAQQRIRDRAARRNPDIPSWDELEKEHEGRVTLPESVVSTQPAYPKDSFRGSRNVKVEYSVTIGLDGQVRDPRPESEEALDSDTSFFVLMFLVLREWEFRPAQLEGAPVETRYRLTTEWQIR